MHKILTLPLILGAAACAAALAVEPELQEGLQASLTVVVRDQQGNRLPGATVTVWHHSTSSGASDTRDQERIEIADRFGQVHLEHLVRGQYEIQVQLSGLMDTRLGPFELQFLRGRPGISDGQVEVVMIPLSLCHPGYW
jgi:hypothetical protein